MKLKQTLKAWPVIALATIGLCYLTQLVAGWFGVELPEQKNVGQIREMFRHAFESWRYFGASAINAALVLGLLPALEELVFRYLIFMLPVRFLRREGTARNYSSPACPHAGRGATLAIALMTSIAFSAAHYIMQPFPDNAFIALGFFGFMQCWLYLKTDRLWCPILNHALFNLTNLILLLIIPIK